MGKVSNEITVDEVEVDAEVDVVAAVGVEVVVDVEVVDVVEVVDDLLVDILAGEVVGIGAVDSGAGGSGFFINTAVVAVGEDVEDVDA